MSKKSFIISTSTIVIMLFIVTAVFLKVSIIDILLFMKLIISKFFLLYALAVALFIFLDNDQPYRTLSWLLVLLLLPYVGIVLYILLGKNVRPKRVANRKIVSDVSIEERVAESQTDAISYLVSINEGVVLTRHTKIIKLLLKNSNSLFSVNNRVEVLTNGVQTFSRIMRSLLEAKEDIYMEYFIIKDDKLGNKIKDILIEKAKDGVKVKIMYDAVGCWKLGKEFKKQLIEAGVEIYPFCPVAFPVLSRRLNYRNHRKILIVDGKTGYLGGLNIGDEYLGKSEKLGFWRDTHLKIEGEGVRSLEKIFINDWKFVSGEILESNQIFKPLTYEKHCILQIAASGPDSDWQNIQQGYFSIIATANERIWIETPYLVPDDSLRMALKTAALSGIDVKIIIPNKPDHFFVYWASRDNIEGLAEAGVKIYTYERGFIHSKILTVDGIVASVGTANMDIRSFGINYEVNAFIYGKDTIERLEQDFISDLQDSKMIDYEKHLKRGLKEKVLEALGRLVSPIQ
ncbi:MAG: cardiolipin synthase [Bacillota bacterium]|nr:cardiolipin synthase [Bacillota bacterium]